MIDDVKTRLKQVFLSHSVQTVENHINDAIKNELSYEQFLKNMLDDEVAYRKTKRIETKIKNAHIPVIKSIEQFDFSFPTKIPKQLIVSLISGKFISEKKNITGLYSLLMEPQYIVIR